MAGGFPFPNALDANSSMARLKEAVENERRSEWSNFVDGEDELIEQFTKLLFETLRYKQIVSFRFNPDSAMFPAKTRYQTDTSLPVSLLNGWESWALAYRSMVERQPKLKLAMLLTKVSEVMVSSSFPQQPVLERIADWLDSGDWRNPDYADLADYVEEKHYAEMREVRVKLGGWIIDPDRSPGPYFISNPDWRLIR